MHEPALLQDIAVALALAFAGGLLARLLGAPTILGYLVAGIAISPFTPGYDGDIETLRTLAELGVIFLMFGVGLHFNLRDLAAVRGIAVLGGSLQIVVTTLVGFLIARGLGLGATEGLLLGLAICIGSTVVAIRALEERGAAESVHGRVLIGWLVVQDIATVFFLVLLPSFEADAGDGVLASTLRAIATAAVFVAAMLIPGARIVPRLLEVVARTGRASCSSSRSLPSPSVSRPAPRYSACPSRSGPSSPASS